jgi:hypothetical protein
LGVGMEAGLHHDVEPGSELIVAARPDLDPRWCDAPVPAGEGPAEDVLERYEPVAPSGQELAERGVGQVGEPDLHGGAAGGEGPLNPAELGQAGHAPKPSPATLLNGEPCSAKLATPPAIGITKPAASAPRRRAASLAPAMSCASARSMRPARAVSQNRGNRPALTKQSLASARHALFVPPPWPVRGREPGL